MKHILFFFLLTCAAFAHGGNDTLASMQHQTPRLPELAGDCDACGCSASGGSMGFSSMMSKEYVGLRYIHQKYSSRDGIFANSHWAEESFNTWQLWAKIAITEKISVVGLLPYHIHLRERVSGNERISGLGDVTLLGYFSVWKTKKDSANWKHGIQLGAGFKAPTGEYHEANNLGSVNPSFQLGTGSWDAIFAAEYVANHKEFGLQLMANYILKTENDKHYRFGNQFNGGLGAFYMLETGGYKMMPQAGLAAEIYEANHQFGIEVANTSGEILFGKIGLEAGTGHFSVGLNAMLPLGQDLNGGRVESRARWSANVNYSL
jgi:hypothetical protein